MLGFIVVGDPKKKNEIYSENALMMLSFIADRAELTVSNILVREQAERDELTGIYNKAYLNNRTRVEVANCLEQGSPLSYIMIDADDFKWFNDNQGYFAGNEVLKALVNAIKNVVRPTDEFCRWSGEELIVLAPGTNKLGGLAAAEKILNTVRTDSKIKQLEKEYHRKISVSIGVAYFDCQEELSEFINEEVNSVSQALFQRSEYALKQAKKSGKDQLCESKPFKLGENDKDILPIKVMIVSNDKEY
ncbi:MAG: GGDEF domain-containing protein [bacterium]|nr:GGDEF domain-containing protein [bacterium]